MNATTAPTLPAIDWPAPIVNNIRSALDDAGCRIERIGALLDSNNADFNDMLAEPGFPGGSVGGRLYTMWMIYLVATEKVGELALIITALTEAAYSQPVSPVGKHTRIRRSKDWRAAADALNAANSVADPSDEAFDAAGAAFEHMLGTRVSSPAELREKLILIDSTRHGIQSGDLNELFRDFDALGWPASQAEG
jgi:hypothetical protein